MCAQFLVKSKLTKIASKVDAVPLKAEAGEWKERILPYNQAPVIVQDEKEKHIRLMQFSLVPSWSKERKVKFATHNARLYSFDEKQQIEVPIYEKPTWRGAFSSRHCLVPMTAFIEPIYHGKMAGNMVSFLTKDEDIFFAAGIWEEWISKKDGEVIDSFSILTDDPVPFVKKIGHSRSPVFLDENAFDQWLEPGKKDPKELLKLLRENKAKLDFTAEVDRPLAKGWEKRA